KRGKIVGHAQVLEILVRINLDGLVGPHEPATDRAFQPPPDESLVFSICHHLSSIGGFRRGGTLPQNRLARRAVLASELTDAQRKTPSCTPRGTRRIRHELHGHSLG